MTAHLIEKLSTELNYPSATPDALPQLIADHPLLALFFAGDPQRYPESLDVAVVLPELVHAFDGAFQAVVVAPEHEGALREKYPFGAWPSLVFLRDGVQVATLSKMRDWADYMDQIRAVVHPQDEPPDTIHSLQV